MIYTIECVLSVYTQKPVATLFQQMQSTKEPNSGFGTCTIPSLAMALLIPRWYSETHLKDLDHIAASLKTLRPEVCYTIIAALETCTSYQEALDFTGESIHNHPLDERFKATYHRLNRLFLDGDAQRGAVIAVHYPWMSFEHRKRTAAVIVSSTAHMEGLSGGVLTLGESKTIAGTPKRKSRHVRWLDHDIAKPFAIDGTAIAKGSAPAKDFDKKAKLATKVSVPDSDVLGVFATQDVIRGTLLLSDTTVTGATNVKTPKMCGNCFAKLTRFDYTLPGYGVRWCSSLCRDLAVATYLKPTHDGNQDEKLAWVQQHADRNYEQHPNFPLLLRFLATFVQEKTLHPLSHELAAPLTGNSHGEHKFTFTLHENIATPYRMLRDLGVDVFSDFRFETWVLLVLQHRISINKRAEPSAEGGFMSSVNPCFSMFNHSCESNASWKDVGTTTVEITASKNIKKGEEVYLDYGGTREEQRHWFGEGGCRCTKCRKEGEGFV